MIINFGLKAVSIFIRLFSYVLIAKFTDVADFGAYALAFSYVGMATLIGMFGIDQLLLRQLASGEIKSDQIRSVDEVLSVACLSAISLGVICFGALLLFIPVMTVAGSLLIALIVPMSVTATILTVYLFAIGRSVTAQAIEGTQLLTSFTMLCCVIYQGETLSLNAIYITFCLSWVIAACFACLAAGFSPLSLGDLDQKKIFHCLSDAKRLAVDRLAVMLTARVDVVIMTIVGNPVVQANYFFALKFFELMQQFSDIITNVLLPQILRFKKDSVQKQRNFALKIMLGNSLFHLVSATIIYVSASFVIAALKPELDLVVPILRLTLPVYVVTLSSLFFLQYVYIYKVKRMPILGCIFGSLAGIAIGLAGLVLEIPLIYCFAGSVPVGVLAIYCLWAMLRNWSPVVLEGARK